MLKVLTLSFWVKSPKTLELIFVNLEDRDNSQDKFLNLTQ
jgi:hypothetical protein